MSSEQLGVRRVCLCAKANAAAFLWFSDLSAEL